LAGYNRDQDSGGQFVDRTHRRGSSRTIIALTAPTLHHGRPTPARLDLNGILLAWEKTNPLK
jgi:hypothetical protein